MSETKSEFLLRKEAELRRLNEQLEAQFKVAEVEDQDEYEANYESNEERYVEEPYDDYKQDSPENTYLTDQRRFEEDVYSNTQEVAELKEQLEEARNLYLRFCHQISKGKNSGLARRAE